MYPTVDVITIGHLSCNPFWNESGEPRRPPLATTSLVTSDGCRILVDPSLPPKLMKDRLFDRSGLEPDNIDIVFLTSFCPTHRRALTLFPNAKWLIYEEERDAVAGHLDELADDPKGLSEQAIEAEQRLLQRVVAANDMIAREVSIFPSTGVTPGTCGLLLAGLQTTLVTGDAVLTRDHFQHNRVSENAYDSEQANESLAEVYEIADAIVPGHDNLFYPAGRM